MKKVSSLYIEIDIDSSDPVYCSDECQFLVYSDRGNPPLCTLFSSSLCETSVKNKRCGPCITNFPIEYEDVGTHVKELVKPVCYNCVLPCVEECPAYKFKGEY